MQNVSSVWQSIVNGKYTTEAKVRIGSHEYGTDRLISLSTSSRVFANEHPAIGDCVSAEINLEMIKPEEVIPPMAKIQLFVRVKNDAQTSEWLPRGVYYIDTREEDATGVDYVKLKIHGYDDMLKAEMGYPSTLHGWPAPDSTCLQDIAAAIGVTVDERTIAAMTGGYAVQLPVGYGFRHRLSHHHHRRLRAEVCQGYRGCYRKAGWADTEERAYDRYHLPHPSGCFP